MRENGLPKGWALARIGDAASADVEQITVSGDGEFTYVDISAVDNISKNIVEQRELSRAEAPSRARQVLKPGDVLVSMTRPNLNAVAMLPRRLADAIGSTGFHILRSKGVKPSFLYYLVQSDSFVQAMCQLVLGVLYPAVRPKDIDSFEFGLPPVSEQERIVAEIEALLTDQDAGVAALKRVQANLKRYRASVLKAACEGRLVPTEAKLARKEGRPYETGEQLLARILKERRAKWEADQLAKMLAAGKPPKDSDWKNKYKEPEPPDTTNLPELPEGWAWATVDSLLAEPLRNGHSAKATGTGKGVRTFTLTAVTNADFSEQNTKLTSADPEKVQDLWARPGDIYIERANTPELVGSTALYEGQRNFAIVPDLLIRVRLSECVSRKFIAFVLQSEKSRRYFQSKAQGIAGSMPKIDQTTVESCPIPLPPRSEQDRIVELIESQLTVESVTRKSTRDSVVRADRLRRSILKRAFEGKLVPQDPNDEPASVLLERIRAERAIKASNNPKPHGKPKARRATARG